jgi:hypothetical protein
MGKLHNEKLRNFTFRHESEMSVTQRRNGEIRNAYRSLVGTPEGINHLGGIEARWKTILKFILKKQCV